MLARGTIVTFDSCSGYTCKGILYDVKEPNGTIIHIHGSYGNFYDNHFIQEFASYYNEVNYNLLAFNMETHGAISEGYKKGHYGYFGGAVSSYETSVYDIAGAIKFASVFSNNIVLQGHSQGTDKILNFLWKTGRCYPAILLSPCDSYKLQELWIAPEKIDEQINRIRRLSGDGSMWLDPKEYGIKSGCEYYNIPITKAAFLSLADGFNFRGLRYEDNQKYFTINGSIFIYLGGQDPFQTSDKNTIDSFFKERISNPSLHYYPGGNHDMDGIVSDVAQDIIRWILSLE